MKSVMRYEKCVLLCILIISLNGCGDVLKHPAPYYKVEFSPSPDTTRLIVDTINNAKKNIYVAAYCLTSQHIIGSLIKAHVRGVDVRIILDNFQAAKSSSKYKHLLSNGVAVRKNKKYKAMHNKFMVVDNDIVETGSFNYTDNAEYYNAENVIIIYHNQELVQKYLSVWQKLWDESK